ncbi:MAG: GNAT family protein [Rickettsiales bacterium]
MSDAVSANVFRVFPLLTDGVVSLRNMREDDVVDFFDYHDHPDMRRFITEECFPHSFRHAAEEIRYNRELFRSRQSVYWGIADPSGDKLIGSCGYNYWNKHHRRAEISYDLARDLWGKGLASRAVALAVGYGFRHMRLHRIEATVPADNLASVALLKRLGFAQEGVLRDQKILEGKYRDMLMMALLSDEAAIR